MLLPALQIPIEAAFERLFRSAAATATRAIRGPSEVSWIEQTHNLAAVTLEADIRDALRSSGSSDSVSVASAFIHGNPFKVSARYPLSKPAEAGDLLLVGERRDRTGVTERQALLLQMKVGPPWWKSPASSTCQQALLYGAWPEIDWQSSALRRLPGKHPRTPNPGPCRAAQFGVIPEYGATSYEAWPLISPAVFGSSLPLAAEAASAIRLALGVDATPGPDDGWSRIVQDMLERADLLTYAERSRRLRQFGGTDEAEAAAGHHEPLGERHPYARRGRFAVIVVRHGPQGVLD